MIPRTYELYCEWFLTTYGRPFAASKAEFEAAIKQVQSSITTFDKCREPYRYLDGEEENRYGPA